MKHRLILPILFLGLAGSAAAQAGSVDLPAQIGGAFSVPTTSMKAARFKSTLRQQYDFSCGSAAVATLLTHHYNKPVTEEQVFKAMFQNGDREKIKREGFSMLDMKMYLEGLGFKADGFQAKIDDLATHNVPAIVLIKEDGYYHFVVVKGVKDDRIVIGDPASGTKVMYRQNFEKVWQNGIMFVIHNRMELAQFNRQEDWAVRPKAPIGDANMRGGVDALLLRRGPGDI